MFFGPEKFTEFDKLISLDDLTKFLEFLRFAFAALHSGGKNGDNDYSRCGFAKINNDDTVLLPYTVLSSEKIMVPTFYFNFESAALEGKVQVGLYINVLRLIKKFLKSTLKIYYTVCIAS